MPKLLIATLVISFVECRAQSPAPPPTDSDNAVVIRELLDEVRQLRARVQILESRMPRHSTADSARPTNDVKVQMGGAAPSASHADTETDPADSANSHASHSFLTAPTLNFHGYADLGYYPVAKGGTTSSFRLGQADLFLTSKLSDRLSFLMETAIDSDANNLPGAEIERIFLNYRQNEYLNVVVGRYHSAIGYFNGAFHHGRWFQTTTDRPFLFWFEDNGGILPIHNVGVSVSGRVPSGNLNVNYVVETGNGRAYRYPGSAPVQTINDDNNGKSINVALFATPRAMPGWQLGMSIYRDRATPYGSPSVEQRILTTHVVYIRDRAEFITEGLVMRNRQKAGSGGDRTTNVPAFYTQFSYRFGAASRPYFRFEFMNPAASDPLVSPVLGSLGFRRSYTAGYRRDLSEFCAIKFQITRWRRRDLAETTEGSAQLAFVF